MMIKNPFVDYQLYDWAEFWRVVAWSTVTGLVSFIIGFYFGVVIGR
jgi:hypothetical protein